MSNTTEKSPLLSTMTNNEKETKNIDSFPVSRYPISAAELFLYPIFKVVIHSLYNDSMSTFTHQIRSIKVHKLYN